MHVGLLLPGFVHKLDMWINPGNNNPLQGRENDKLQISTTLMQVMIITAAFSQVSTAQLSALWEAIYSIMLSDI